MATCVAAALLSGCGANLSTPPATGEAYSATQDSTHDDEPGLSKIVVLDWTGGIADITSNPLAATDLAELYLPSGETLEDYADAFQESVRQRVEEILRAIGPATFDVVIGEDENYLDETIVYYTSDSVPGGGLQVGQTRLDRCDLHPGASVIVWGGTLVSLGDEHAYDQWVHAFANIAAHEVGHTVGFFHPDAVLTDLTQYEKDNELMLAVHTLSALLDRQEFLIPQETCPESIEREYGGVAYELIDTAPTKRATVTYKSTPPAEEIIMCDCLGHG